MEFAGIGLFQINSFIKMKLKNRSASKLLELFLIYDSHESKSASETTNLLVIFLYGLEFEASFLFFFRLSLETAEKLFDFYRKRWSIARVFFNLESNRWNLMKNKI
jgi:hypothetical protein